MARSNLRLLCIALVIASNMLLPASGRLRSPSRDASNVPGRRAKRDTSQDVAQIRGDDCPGCSGSYTPYFSGQCYMCPPCTVGPRGAPGQQGVPGRDGRDGRDASINQRQEIGEEVEPHPTPSISSGGAIYTRWGREVCPEQSEVVYHGVAGGAYYTHKGSGSNYLCLPEEPIYDEPVAGTDINRGLVYGSEYQTSDFPPWSHLHDSVAPCAVCHAPSRPSLLMIPARNVCPEGAGWVREFSGYLVSAYHDHNGRSEFVCMDRDAQAVPRSSHNTNGALFYPVEGRCSGSGSGLPCGPYIQGHELTCVVCTK